MAAEIRPVILIAGFGTSQPSGLADLEHVDQLVSDRYPDHEVRWALTSGFILKKLRAGGMETLFSRQVPLRNLAEAYADLRADGKTDVVVQPLLTVTGSEYADLMMTPTDGLNVAYGYPLLAPPDNTAKLARALEPGFGAADTLTLICCHGNAKIPLLNVPLLQLDKYVRKHYQNVFVTSLDGPPGTEAAFADVKASGLGKVIFLPFLFTTGEHVVIDINGDEPHSYKSQLGLESTFVPGISRNLPVMQLWMESVDWALNQL
jgi:sirohydrochlorin cobaltochelatase